MKKLFSTPVIFFMISVSVLYAQDTTKKTTEVKPAAAKTTVKKPETTKPVVEKQAVTQPAPQPAKKTVTVPAQNTDRSLNSQYNYLLTKVYNYQQPVIRAFYKNFSDTLKAERAALKKAQAQVNSQDATIRKLTAKSTIKDEIIADSKAQVDEISVLGISFTKDGYSALMWGLVLALGIALAIVIITTASYRKEAKYRVKLYNELSDEYMAHKSKANEKEIKLARELQTERNKLDELLGR